MQWLKKRVAYHHIWVLVGRVRRAFHRKNRRKWVLCRSEQTVNEDKLLVYLLWYSHWNMVELLLMCYFFAMTEGTKKDRERAKMWISFKSKCAKMAKISYHLPSEQSQWESHQQFPPPNWPVGGHLGYCSHDEITEDDLPSGLGHFQESAMRKNRPEVINVSSCLHPSLTESELF